MRRQYIKEELYLEVMTWGYQQCKEKKLSTPNSQPNFAFFLSKYIEYLKKLS